MANFPAGTREHTPAIEHNNMYHEEGSRARLLVISIIFRSVFFFLLTTLLLSVFVLCLLFCLRFTSWC